MTPAQAANYLGVSDKTLAKWRSTGMHNIAYLKFGTSKRAAVKYERSELDKFLSRCRRGA